MKVSAASCVVFGMAMASLHVPRLATITSLVDISRVKIALTFPPYSNNFFHRLNDDDNQQEYSIEEQYDPIKAVYYVSRIRGW